MLRKGWIVSLFRSAAKACRLPAAPTIQACVLAPVSPNIAASRDLAGLRPYRMASRAGVLAGCPVRKGRLLRTSVDNTVKLMAK